MTGERGYSMTVRRLAPVVVGLVVLGIAVLVWLLVGGRDETAPVGAASTGTATTPAVPSAPGGSADPSSGPSSGRSAGASGGPASTGPSASPTTLDTRIPSPAPVVRNPPKPVRATFGTAPRLRTGVSVDVVGIEPVRGVARGVGEVAGPALRFTVRVRNTGSAPVDLDLAVVTAYSGPRDAPATQLSGPGARPFPAALAPDGSATGSFVFAVPPAARDRLRLDFTYDAAAPRVVFTGAAAAG